MIMHFASSQYRYCSFTNKTLVQCHVSWLFEINSSDLLYGQYEVNRQGNAFIFEISAFIIGLLVKACASCILLMFLNLK